MMPKETIILYDGKQIASFSAGQTATLTTKGDEVEHNIVVQAGNTEKVVSTHALYNGVKLPIVPNSAERPFSMILRAKSSETYKMYQSTNPWYFYSTSNYPSTVNNDGNNCYRYSQTDIGWECITADQNDYLVLGDANEIVWSNHDIRNGSATATDIYFEGTEPVPSEETETIPIVITYDGNEIATLEAGQTATIKCANTEADFDIVVKAESTKPSAPTVSGKWVFVDNVDELIISKYPVNVQVGEINASYITGRRDSLGCITIDAFDANNTQTIIYNAFTSVAWRKQEYKTWDFGDTEQIVSSKFLTWLKANATKQ